MSGQMPRSQLFRWVEGRVAKITAVECGKKAQIRSGAVPLHTDPLCTITGSFETQRKRVKNDINGCSAVAL